jgi:hypothetical protein
MVGPARQAARRAGRAPGRGCWPPGSISASSRYQLDPGPLPPPTTTVAGGAAGRRWRPRRPSALPTAAHTRSASLAEQRQGALGQAGMAKSLGLLPSASTSRVQPIGAALVSSRLPGRSKRLISVG